MAYVITSLCERAGDCAFVCPVDAIHTVEGNDEWPLYYISPELCIECGACAAECPNEAIFHEDDIPDDYVDDIDKNEDFFISGPGADLI